MSEIIYTKSTTLYKGDCLKVLPLFKEKSVDMIICDLPYGKTKNHWDSLIPAKPLWDEYHTIIKDHGVIALFGQDKFTAEMIILGKTIHRYNLVWDKVLKSGFLNANKQPMRQHEDIMIFYKKQPVYNPQFTLGKPNNDAQNQPKNNTTYGTYNLRRSVRENPNEKFPTSILTFQKPVGQKKYHPAQKPIALLEWLINTYTDKGMLILDNAMGSGTTGIAAINTERKFIGIEKEEKYFNISQKLITDQENGIVSILR